MVKLHLNSDKRKNISCRDVFTLATNLLASTIGIALLLIGSIYSSGNFGWILIIFGIALIIYSAISNSGKSGYK